jgi:thiol-disulfide isomerase/thioredoxin
MNIGQLLNAKLNCVIGGPIEALAEDMGIVGPMTSSAVHLPVEGNLPSFDGANEWLNSPPLTAAGLRGKVVLVNFWTYTCINWLRTFPYVRAWVEKYQDHGLVMIGVHTPEFTIERNVDNVRQALKTRMIDYPVAIDNDYAIWGAFNNHYWPALYFVDAQGHIRHHQWGEGDYERSEMVIRSLLSEAGMGDIDPELITVTGSAQVEASGEAQGAEAAADWSSLRSPETYVGYERAENFVSTDAPSPGRAVINQAHDYTAPTQLSLNEWSLSGNWKVGRQAVALNKANGRVAYCFHARDLHLVMGPVVKGASVRFRVLVDGQPPDAAHGSDIDTQGNGTATEQRLYQLIRQSKPIVDRLFEIEFLDSGAEVFAFTFG